MADWKVDESGQSIGPLYVGMSIDEVKLQLGTGFHLFRRTPECLSMVAAFDQSGVQVVVDRSNRVRGVLVFPPNTVTLRGVHLLEQRMPELQTALAASGLDFVPCDVGLWNEPMNLCLVEVDGKIDAVEIGNDD
jgi:hypothetical protein